MQIKPDFVLKKLAGEYVIIPTGTGNPNFNGFITLNETGIFLWRLLRRNRSEEELVSSLLAEFDVEENIAREDVREFIETLAAGGVLAEEENDEKQKISITGSKTILYR